MTSARKPQKSAETRGHGAKSAAIREAAVLALLSEPTIKQAAERAGIHERTLRGWIVEDEAFKLEYQAARRTTYEAGMNRIHALTTRAVETLEDLLRATQYPSVRLGAARTIAELGIHHYDAETIMRKLHELEARQQSRR